MARYLLIWLGLIVAACNQTPTAVRAQTEPATAGTDCASKSKDPIRFLALGDSYTIGTAVEPSERWPVQLAGLLREKGVAIEEPKIIATRGWTTSNLLGGIERENPTGSYDLVSVLIGVNDQVRGFNADQYREKFVTLLERAITLASQKPARVLVLSLPDWSMAPIARSQDPEAIKAEIDNFNRVNRVEAEQRGVHYIDITPSSRQAAQDRTLLAKDQLHPAGQMYTTWARLVLPVACQALAGE